MQNSAAFFIACFVLLLIHRLLPGTRAKKILILLASIAAAIQYMGLAFAAALGAFSLSLIFAFFASLKKGTSAFAPLLATSLLFPIAYMIWAKTSTAFSCPLEGCRALQPFTAAIGAQFMMLSAMHVAVDVSTKKIKMPGLGSAMRFLFFFPTLMNGPIKRMQNFLQQEEHKAENTIAETGSGAFRAMLGLLKIQGIAQPLFVFAESVISSGQSGLAALMGVYAFSIAVYLNLSGLADVAIGISLCFGYKIEENFDWPYFASSPAEFWSRWNLTLTSFIYDYIYSPIKDSAKNRLALFVAAIASAAAIALWQGPSSASLWWAALHLMGIAVWAAISNFIDPIIAKSRPAKLLCIFLTFHFVSFCWLVLRLDLIGALNFIVRIFA